MQGSGQIGGLLTMTRAKTPYLPTYPQAAQRSEKRRKIGGTYLLQGPLAWGGVVKTGPTYCIGCLAQTPYLARSRNPVYTPRSPELGSGAPTRIRGSNPSERRERKRNPASASASAALLTSNPNKSRCHQFPTVPIRSFAPPAPPNGQATAEPGRDSSGRGGGTPPQLGQLRDRQKMACRAESLARQMEATPAPRQREQPAGPLTGAIESSSMRGCCGRRGRSHLPP